MNGLEFLDLVIGLIFIYLIYSIACSTLWEIIISFSQLRGEMLFKWIINTFSSGQSDLGKKIIEHPLIKGLSPKRNLKPSYISSAVFADVLLDVLNIDSQSVNAKKQGFNSDALRKSIKESNLLDGNLQRVFLQYFEEAEGKLNIVKEKISLWYDEAQQRLMGSPFWFDILSKLANLRASGNKPASMLDKKT
jgi:hypothetical protein